MKKTLFTLFALVALVGCNKEQISTPSPVGKDVFTVEAAPYENAYNDSATKSKYFDKAGQKITNLNVWVYVSSTGALANTGTIPGTSLSYKTYFENQTQLDGDLLFPDFDETYDIYIFTNVGQKTPPASKSAADAFKYSFNSYDSFSSNGFPMAAHYKFRPSDPSVSHSLLATRLVSKYTVTFDFRGDNNYDFVLKSATVKQSANVITPFTADSKASSISDVFESADELDVTKLTVPAGQDLYMLENVQGTVFGSGVERSEKNIAYQAKPVTSYLEFVGELDKNDGTGYNKVTCRYYFGSGTYAGVKRNFNIPLTLTMSNSILNHDEWIVTPEEPYNTGYVVFNPTSLSIVGDGNWNAFSAQPYSAEGINDNVKYTLSYNSSDFSTAGLTLQYRKSTSGAWTNYSGQELTGKYYFQVKSTYTGSTQKTVKIFPSVNGQIGTELPITTAYSSEYDFSIGCAGMGNGTDWSASVTNMILGPEDGGVEPYKIDTGSDIPYFYFREPDDMIHLYGPLEYFGSLSFQELRWDLLTQNLFVEMTDGEHDYEIENSQVSLAGTSFENAMIVVDLEVSFSRYLTKGKSFDINFY